MTSQEYREFYASRAAGKYFSDAPETQASTHYYSGELRNFIAKYGLRDKKCLEIGAGKGIFQDAVIDYTGLDVSESLRKHHRKRFVCVKGDEYPLADNSFDAAWTLFCHEHIPNLHASLCELKRVLKPGGYLFFAPAWQCTSWLSGGYCYRPYSDLSFREKIIKSSILIRSSVLYRAAKIFPKRMLWYSLYLCGFKFEKIRYKNLAANYEVFWGPDSDACNSIEPHNAILWFVSNGFACLSHSTHAQKFFVRTGALVFQKNG